MKINAGEDSFSKVLLNISKVTCRLLDVDVVTLINFVQKFVCVQYVMTKRNYMM